MLKFVSDGPDGSKLVFIGLTEGNLNKFLDEEDTYIPVDLRELGVTDRDIKVMIFGGRFTESEYMERMMKRGALGPQTKISIDPDTLPDQPPPRTDDVVETIIVRVPPEMQFDQGNVHDLGPVVQEKLRNLAMRQIMDMKFPPGVSKLELQQITWILTSSADEVASMKPPHDCAACREAMARAAAELRQKPEQWMAIGRVEYRRVFGNE